MAKKKEDKWWDGDALYLYDDLAYEFRKALKKHAFELAEHDKDQDGRIEATEDHVKAALKLAMDDVLKKAL